MPTDPSEPPAPAGGGGDTGPLDVTRITGGVPIAVDQTGPVDISRARENPGYPKEWEADVVLKDGSVVLLRPIVPDDFEGVHAFHERQSQRSVYLRFFAPIPRLSDRDVRRFTTVDHHDRVALVATLRDEIIGIGRYDRLQPGGATAEVAFNISDRHQGKGIGSVLLEHLAAIGQENGIQRFIAEVLPENRRMISVFGDAGYAISREFDDGVIAVEFAIEPTDSSREVRQAREQRAESRSMQRLLGPASVAVIGLGTRGRTIGREVLDHVLDGAPAARVYAVSASSGPVRGLDPHPTIHDLPEAPELAIVAVPAENAVGVVQACGRAGVGSVIVVSGGFAEDGPEGQERQARLLRVARRYGMRVVGPNSFGVVNTAPDVRLNASLAPVMPARGGLGLFAQSGALGIALLDAADRRGLGISTLASAGNRVDVSGNDLMQYWIDDDATQVVGLYLESMGNPRKFSRIARHLATTKPVIVLKSGAGESGGPAGHRVRRTTARPEAFQSMLRQAGVIRVDNATQLFDVAQVVLHQPLPAGERVAIVSNSDALGTLAAHACGSWSLRVSHGPVTLPVGAGAREVGEVVEAALADPEVDSLVCCFVPPIVTEDVSAPRAVAEVAARHDKPVVGTFLGMLGVTQALRVDGDGDAGATPAARPGGVQDRVVPAYAMPEDAVRALAAATRYGLWRARDRGPLVRRDGIDRRDAHDLVETALAASPGGCTLTPVQVARLLADYGIPAETQPIAPDDPPGVLPPEGGELAWSPTDPTVRHLTVTSVEDPLFGPVVSVGLAGVASELLGDVTHRIPPLVDGDLKDLLGSLRAAPLLGEFRGAPAVARPALEDVLARVSLLADDLPEVAELRLEPVAASAEGSLVRRAGVRLASPQARKDRARRSL